MKNRSFERLMELECYAYNRWLRHFSNFWYRLAKACNRAVRAHPDYRGVQ